MDEYILLEDLPSQFKPYPEGAEIRYRALNFKEVAVITNLYERQRTVNGGLSETDENRITGEIIRKIQDAGVIKVSGMNFMDLTLGDWLFIYLCIMAESHMNIVYKVQVPCSACSGALSDTGINLKLAQSDVTPGQIEFDSVEDEVEMPIMLETDNGEEIEIDFFRLRHYLKRLKNPQINELDLIISPENTQLSIQDVTNITFVRGMMSHLPEESVDVTCPACKNVMSVDVKWSEFALTVKSQDEGSRRARIHFGKRSQSAGRESVPNAVPESDPIVRRIGRPRKKDE